MSNFCDDYNIILFYAWLMVRACQINIFIFFSFLIHFLVILLYLYIYLPESQKNHGGANT